MDHFVTIPINENGIFTSPNVDDIIREAMELPFAFTDVFIYSHGWWTNAARAMTDYNTFSVGFARIIKTLVQLHPTPVPHLPSSSFSAGIHWPSMLSEDTDSMENYLEAMSFYTMEKRADTVGEHGVYSILRLILQAHTDAGHPLRLNLLGHSFGCKVICSALQEIYSDPTLVVSNFVSINVVLMQAAFDNDDLESGNIYGSLANKPDLRILATRSDEDKALNHWYPIARKANIFGSGGARLALGAVGASSGVASQYGPYRNIEVPGGFTCSQVAQLTERFIMADLTPLHQTSMAPEDSFSGRHSDIFHDEIYQLISGFLFQ
ncbi:MAG: alpha/beta hydrolase [Nitrospiria bacterium]